MYVTLSINPTSVRLLSVKGRQIDKWGSMPIAPGLVKNGLIMQPKVVGTVINALFESTEVPRERVITCVAGLPFVHRFITLPRMKPVYLPEAIRRVAKKEMPMPLDNLYLSWQNIGRGNDELDDLFVLGIPRDPVDAVIQTLVHAGVKPYIMDIKPLALARAANQEEAIIIDMEQGFFDIVLVANGIPSAIHAIFPRGGATLEDNIKRLSDGLQKTVEYHNSNEPENQISPDAPVLVTGELSNDEAASELLRAQTGYHIQSLAPPFELPSSLPVSQFSANVGLALKKVSLRTVEKGDATLNCGVDINIFSGKYGVKRGWINLRNILLLLALIIAAGLLFPNYQLKRHAEAETVHSQTEVTVVKNKLEQALIAYDDAKQVEDMIDEVSANSESIKQERQALLSSRGDNTNSLKLITNSVPDEAYFTNMEIETNGIMVEGHAASPFTVVKYVRAIEALGAFSEARIAWIDEIENEASGLENNISFRIAVTK